MVYRESVVVAWTAENKQQQRETRDHMAAKTVKRVVQKMAEGDHNQNATEGNECVASAQANNDKRAGNQLNERDGDAGGPQGPNRQKCVAEGQKIFSGVLERSQLKNLHNTGHEKDEAENKTGEKQRPCATKIRSHRQTQIYTEKRSIWKAGKEEGLFFRSASSA